MKGLDEGGPILNQKSLMLVGQLPQRSSVNLARFLWPLFDILYLPISKTKM